MEREADVSGILSQTVDVIGAAGRAVLIYVVVLGLFNGIGGLAGLAEMDDNVFSVGIRSGVLNAETLGLAATLYQLLGLVLYVVAAFFLLRQMLEQIGRPARGGNLLSYVAMSVLAMIGLMIGFVLLVIPGLILLVRWSAANGFLLSGDKGITGALGTSWEATGRRGWSIFGAGLVLWVGLAVLSSIVVGIVAATGFTASGGFSPLFGVAMTVSGLIEAFNNAASFAFSIAVFHLVAPADTSVADVFE
ncbi:MULTISPECIES: hypothetical protein [Citromicrobium]|uniref:hypothetical protein n=1 Tax=Citromicrobium TaxID=72173 RepID=UPI0001DD0F80|nr:MULTISPECIES: hypothetical protein [Citromicrobium]ALG61407.1 hypothetical protein WG74_11615 [Citromicrobium sp. JL477]KPM14358.1 hypothetical protein VO58_11135 [Citromicrobium sp. JL1351]KPM20839.1 hypothetical protein VM77_00020 [Citromicrobium sp. JL31]KPM25221.1 hypothetical protein AAJ72_05975 [Citromicrobium sp. RCC1885]KPM26824.1 hypothetical protein VO57_06035 [Citromicrobium sp. JL2201]|tara:strand:- start:377 stop:1120 length:744 start_codon:yes stop_codon:yes gene_type:complete